MKQIALSIGFFFFLVFTSQAQVILLDSDGSQGRVVVEGEPPFIPVLGVTYDQYAPLSGGAMLLSSLGVVYLMKKKRKEKE